MIVKLTKEQEAKLPTYVEKYLNVGLNPGRMDKAAATAAVKLAYERAGLPMPEEVIFCTGPFDSDKKIKYISDGKFNALSGAYFGSFNAAQISYIQFMNNEFGDELEDAGVNLRLIEGITNITHYCGIVNMFDTHVFISERPIVIRFDDRNLLHCEDGPAIAYEDGFTVYSWHGQRVPKTWIEEGVSAKEALTCENIEQRRAACEIVGWDKILDDLNVEVIHEDGDPEIGTLVAVDIPDIGREHYLRVKCGTGRGFAIPVPPECKTALEANAWTYGLESYEYRPEVRT